MRVPSDTSLAGGSHAGAQTAAPRQDWRRTVHENPAFSCLKRARRVLMLQGPVGPFFDRMARWLLARNCAVQRVVFQGGDEEDCRVLRPIRFTGRPAEWPAFLDGVLSAHKSDCVVLFGQGRTCHRVALERARESGVPVVVLEEGYFRPGFATMELGGVNGRSTTLDQFVWTPNGAEARHGVSPSISPLHFQKMAWHAARHYVALDQRRHRYPHYEHHREADPLSYARYWSRSWLRKALHGSRDRRFQRWLIDTEQPYFFVPLQLEGDTQITQHSRFRTVAEFVQEVLHSFARHAASDALLVLRQHPHARGGPGDHGLIRSLARQLGIVHRVHHLVEGDTPELAQHSLGTVLINSTVGLQALERGSPLIVLGEAPYRKAAFTFTGPLDDFWRDRAAPEPEITSRFLAQMKNLTQVPASLYAGTNEPLAWLGSVFNPRADEYGRTQDFA